MSNEPAPSTYPICEHIRDDNTRCGSPALKDRPFCWHHSRLRSSRSVSGKLKFTVGSLDNQQSIQIVLAQVVQAVINDELSTTKANTIIRALRLAHTTIKAAGPLNTETVDIPESALQQLSKIDGEIDEPETIEPPYVEDTLPITGPIISSEEHDEYRRILTQGPSHPEYQAAVAKCYEYAEQRVALNRRPPVRAFRQPA